MEKLTSKNAIEEHKIDWINGKYYNEDSHVRGKDFECFVGTMLNAAFSIRIDPIADPKLQVFRGENLQGMEIKLDERSTDPKCNHLSIEIGEKHSKKQLRYSKSGIFTRDNSWLYIQGNYREFWVFSKYQLVKYFNKHKPKVHILPKLMRFFLERDQMERLSLLRFDIDNCRRK